MTTKTDDDLLVGDELAPYCWDSVAITDAFMRTLAKQYGAKAVTIRLLNLRSGPLFSLEIDLQECPGHVQVNESLAVAMASLQDESLLAS